MKPHELMRLRAKKDLESAEKNLYMDIFDWCCHILRMSIEKSAKTLELFYLNHQTYDHNVLMILLKIMQNRQDVDMSMFLADWESLPNCFMVYSNISYGIVEVSKDDCLLGLK